MSRIESLPHLMKTTGVVTDHRYIEWYSNLEFYQPDDLDRVYQLSLKQEEYEQRYEYTPGPRQPFLHRAKKFLLKTALEDNGTTLSEAWNEFQNLPETLASQDMFIAPERRVAMWLEAADVIIDYIDTGGQNVSGGRLPELG